MIIFNYIITATSIAGGCYYTLSSNILLNSQVASSTAFFKASKMERKLVAFNISFRKGESLAISLKYLVFNGNTGGVAFL